MNRFQFALRAITISGLLLLANSLALAQATRTWVSGVGDDANPCSRTAPCKTFAGAISKTAAGGEINCIDSGGFGGVTIVKSITIDGNGVHGGVLVGSNAIVVNAGVNDVVTIRNLAIILAPNSGAGFDGVRYLAGAALHVENCQISNFTGEGIDVAPTAAGTLALLVKDTVIRNNGGGSGGAGVAGIHIHPTNAAGFVEASLDGVRFVGNRLALKADDRTTVAIRDSVASRHFTNVFVANSTGPVVKMTLRNCLISNNNFNASVAGIRSTGAGSVVRISDCTVVNNSLGLVLAGGTIISFGNNDIAGNGNDTLAANGAPSSTIPQQ